MSVTRWIMRRMASDFLARQREYGMASLAAYGMRSARVFAYISEHRQLLQLDVVRNYLAAGWNKNFFHHLNQRGYLIEGLSARQRIQCVLTHYQFEDRAFNAVYKSRLYLENGIVLWKYHVDGKAFSITLTVSPRWAPEGELSVCFIIDGQSVHSLSFNWIGGSMVGLPDDIVPFIGRNQGAACNSLSALTAFNEAFPHNSPSFFCFAAMQGIAYATGLGRVVGIRANANICFETATAKNFANAYDKFWKNLGGTDLPGAGYLINLPFYSKPLSSITARHRKRAAMRRSYWESISSASRNTLRAYLLPNQVRQCMACEAGMPVGERIAVQQTGVDQASVPICGSCLRSIQSPQDVEA
jgi:uncharacterized protein VirK/YbjX